MTQQGDLNSDMVMPPQDEAAQGVRAAVGKAVAVKMPDARSKKAAPKKDKPEEIDRGNQPASAILPDDCPVVPLGNNDNEYYYLDASRQLRVLKASDHARLGVLSLFNHRSEYLWNNWPRKNEEGHVSGYRPELAAEALMGACAMRGVLDVVDRVRGPGCWQDDDGQLVLHCGDTVFHEGRALNPGSIGRHIYPSAPEKPRPSTADADTDLGEELLALLRSWKWRRADIDPYLLLGWIGASMVGGALKWRPMIWLTGDAATGKSTLHEILKSVHGPGGIIHATDPTAAGLWQSVGHASLPIALDELESEADNRKNMNIIKLARHAASGGTTLRGGSDHKGTTFTVRSCFLFSSILIPPLLGQDMSRMAILQLDTLDRKSAAPRLEPKRLAEIGAGFRKRLLDNWPRFRDTLEAYKAQLQTTGHSGRSADQFGTLLACADLLLYNAKPDSEALIEWAEKLAWAGLAEAEDAVSDSDRCISHLLSSSCDVMRDGKRRSLGSWIEQAMGRFDSADHHEADKVLASYGLRVERPKTPAGKECFLLVSNSHEGLRAIFRDTNWAGLAGSTGVWVQSMRRVPGSSASKTSTNFGGAPSRYTRIPLAKIFTDDKGSEDAA